MITLRNLAMTATTLGLLVLSGCNQPMTPDPNVKPAQPAPDAPGKVEAPKDKQQITPLPVDPPKGAASAEKLTDEQVVEVKKLPPADQAIALAQVTCPVSDDHLGEMGMPIKQTIGDKTFFLCCKGCIDKVKSNPDEVLAKLKK